MTNIKIAKHNAQLFAEKLIITQSLFVFSCDLQYFRTPEFSLNVSSLIVTTYNISICKKGKVEDEASKKIRDTNGGQIKKQDVPLT